MQTLMKCLLVYFMIITIIIDYFLFSVLYSEEKRLIQSFHFAPHQEQRRNFLTSLLWRNRRNVFQQKTADDFLVLDWTATKHIFQENDPIQCDFSHINLKYCREKFRTIENITLRLNLIVRCHRLSKLRVRWTDDQSFLKQADVVAYHSIHMPFDSLPPLIRNNEQQQYSTVYVLESEVHSRMHRTWADIDFPMWYNLARSYPEPATYFNVNTYLDDLFQNVKVPFTRKKTSAPIAWMASNCNAYNARHVFIKELMSYIAVDSYGKCNNNVGQKSVLASRGSNLQLYSSYKFVIVIENSNCEDYVTEKFIEAIASTAIPIVAGRDGKPDYSRFAPKHSYINVYDYKSVKDLAAYLTYLSQNETAYNGYLWYRQAPLNRYQSSNLIHHSLQEKLQMAAEIFGVNSGLFQWLLTKEASINRYCKLANFIYTNHWESIYRRTRSDRPKADEICLPKDDLANYFH